MNIIKVLEKMTGMDCGWTAKEIEAAGNKYQFEIDQLTCKLEQLEDKVAMQKSWIAEVRMVLRWVDCTEDDLSCAMQANINALRSLLKTNAGCNLYE